MSIGLIAVGTACAVAGAAAGVIGTRRHLAQGYAQLAVEQVELDHAGDMQDLRYAELAAWSDDLGIEEDRLAQWDAFFRARFGTEPDTIGSTVEEEDIEVPVNRERFGWERTGGVAAIARELASVQVGPARPEPGEVLREQAGVLFAETRALTDYAAEVADSAPFGAEHFESEALNAELQAILADGAWGLLNGGELTEALTAARVGMPTGQYPVLGTQPNPWDQPKPGDPAPKPKRLVEHDGTQDPERVAAAALMHAAATRTRPTEDEQPTPQPKPSPAVVGAA